MAPWIRSVLAIVLGYVAIFVVIMVFQLLVGNPILEAAGWEQGASPPVAYVTVNLAYSLLAAVAGGATAARVAGRAPLAHGLALGLAMAVLGTVFAFQSPAPGWYEVALILLPIPGVLLGAILAARLGEGRAASAA